MRIVLSDTQWYPEKVAAMSNGVEHLHLLYSYFFDRGVKISKNLESIRENKPKECDFYLDSGVFSANSVGIKIPVDELIEYYKKNSDIINFVFNMDSGGVSEQLDNCKKMKSSGLPVIGVWHWNSMKLDDFKRFLDITDYMSVGAVARMGKKGGVLDKLYEYLYKNNLEKTKLHILGTEAPDVLISYPIYSADSSKIVKSAIYGNNAIYDKKRISIEMTHPRKEPLLSLKKYVEYYKFI
jgi:hypothetical protein